MDNEQGHSRDLAAMVVPQAGRLVVTEDVWEPYQLLDPTGTPVKAVSDWSHDLQAAGRSPATLRSYGLDLLRWFRFLWAADVGARHPHRGAGLSVAGCWWPASQPGRTGAPSTNSLAAPRCPRRVSATPPRSARTARGCCAASTSSTGTPAPGRSSTRSRWIDLGAVAGRTRITTRWSPTATSAPGFTGQPCPTGSRAASRRAVQRAVRAAALPP